MAIIFIVDIDGTICDSLDRIKENDRQHIGEANYWTHEKIAEFLSDENLKKDKIIKGSERIFDIAKRFSAIVIFLTGRNDFSRKGTRKWLTEVFKAPLCIPLIMRNQSQGGKSTADCKEELFLDRIYNKNDIFIFFEDEPNSIQRLSKYGLVLRAPECWEVLI